MNEINMFMFTWTFDNLIKFSLLLALSILILIIAITDFEFIPKSLKIHRVYAKLFPAPVYYSSDNVSVSQPGTDDGESNSQQNSDDRDGEKNWKRVLKIVLQTLFFMGSFLLVAYILMQEDSDFSYSAAVEQYHNFMRKFPDWNKIVSHIQKTKSFAPPLVKENYNITLDLYEKFRLLNPNNPVDMFSFWQEMQNPTNKHAVKVIGDYFDNVEVVRKAKN